MKSKEKLLFLFLAIGLMFILQPGTVFAEDGSIMVNNEKITDGQPINCGNGTATYDAATNTLTLNNAVIDANFSGIGIDKKGVILELVGNNIINSKQDCIWSNYPLTIKGTNDGYLTATAGTDGIYGIHSPAIEICDVSVLTVITNNSGPALSARGKITISNSTVTVSAGDNNSIFCGDLEISNTSKLTANAGGTYSALFANNTIAIHDSSIDINADNSYGIYCNDLEVTDSSEVNVTAYWPALYANNSISICSSTVDTKSETAIGIQCGMYGTGTLDIMASKIYASSGSNVGGLYSGNDLTIQDSTLTIPGDERNESIFAENNLSITGGTAEIEDGKIRGGHVFIGGMITSHGTLSFENIESYDWNDGTLTFLPADYTAVDKAIADADDRNKNDYANFDTVEAAIKAVVRNKDIREQAIVDGYAAAINAAIAALIPVSSDIPAKYQITEGADQTVLVVEGKSVTIKCNGDYNKFQYLSVDGAELAREFYTAVSGSTIVTLKSEYVKTLTTGVHSITFHYTDGQVQTTLTVTKSEVPENPEKPDKPENPNKPHKPGRPDKPDEPTWKPVETPSKEPSSGKTPSPADSPSYGISQSPSQNSGQGLGNGEKSPQTGDHTPVRWFLAFALVSILALVNGVLQKYSTI